MFDRLKAAVKAFTTSLPGATGHAAKAFYSIGPASANYPSTAVAFGNGKVNIEGVINNLPLAHLRDYASYLEAGSRKVWASWKACDIVSKIIQETPRKFVRVAGNKETEVENNEELNALFAKANPYETFNELLARAVFHIKLTGNCFIAKDQTDLQGNRPRALYLLNPRRITLALDRNSQILGYIYIVGNGRTIPFSKDEVIHVKLPHPDRDYWGLGEVEASEDLYNDFINRQTWLQKFWENGASPSGILFQKTQQVVNEEDWEKAKAKWQHEYGGSKNSGKTAWLSGEWGYLQMGLTAQEMQTIESATWSVEQIFHVAGIPLSVAGIKEAANYATANVDDVRMRRYTIKPLIHTFEDKINDGLIQGFDPDLRLRFNVQGLIDIEASSKSIPLLVGAAVFSPNDAREFLGMERMDDPMMDQYYLMSTMVPIEQAGMAQIDQTKQQSDELTKRFAIQFHQGGEREQLPDRKQSGARSDSVNQLASATAKEFAKLREEIKLLTNGKA